MWWYLRSQLFEWIEQRRVREQFYSQKNFKQVDQALLEAYRQKNGYAISKAFLLQKGYSNPYLYGETPLTTVYQMARHFGLTNQDCLIELGAGRCRAALFLAEIIGCRVIAVEQIPHFVHIAKTLLPSEKVTILNKDFFELDFSSASAIYLYGSHLSDEEIARLSLTFQKLPPNVKILTVSYPLPGYKITGEITGRFPWGKTSIYCNQRML